ncbi:hypothetical protein GGF50DRAFT_109430 [Schizophyllum commune]
MQDVFVRQLKNATDEEIERIVAVNVAAFADDEFNRILVGGDISILPLLMRAQIKAGLLWRRGTQRTIFEDFFTILTLHPRSTSPASATKTFPPQRPEQGEAGFNDFMGAIGEDTRNWWAAKFLPFYGATTTEAFGEGFKKANWHLQLLATEPRSQRKGLASALVKRMDEQARAEGKALTVETETEGALAFYKANGFKLKAEKPVPTDDVEDVERPIPMYVLWKNHGARAGSPLYTS